LEHRPRALVEGLGYVNGPLIAAASYGMALVVQGECWSAAGTDEGVTDGAACPDVLWVEAQDATKAITNPTEPRLMRAPVARL
jgi:hypothetical protein